MWFLAIFTISTCFCPTSCPLSRLIVVTVMSLLIYKRLMSATQKCLCSLQLPNPRYECLSLTVSCMLNALCMNGDGAVGYMTSGSSERWCHSKKMQKTFPLLWCNHRAMHHSAPSSPLNSSEAASRVARVCSLPLSLRVCFSDYIHTYNINTYIFIIEPQVISSHYNQCLLITSFLKNVQFVSQKAYTSISRSRSLLKLGGRKNDLLPSSLYLSLCLSFSLSSAAPKE